MLLALRDHASHPSPGVLHVALSARDQMEVAVADGLPRRRPVVQPEVEPGDALVGVLKETSSLPKPPRRSPPAPTPRPARHYSHTRQQLRVWAPRNLDWSKSSRARQVGMLRVARPPEPASLGDLGAVAMVVTPDRHERPLLTAAVRASWAVLTLFHARKDTPRRRQSGRRAIPYRSLTPTWRRLRAVAPMTARNGSLR